MFKIVFFLVDLLVDSISFWICLFYYKSWKLNIDVFLFDFIIFCLKPWYIPLALFFLLIYQELFAIYRTILTFKNVELLICWLTFVSQFPNLSATTKIRFHQKLICDSIDDWKLKLFSKFYAPFSVLTSVNTTK